MSISHLAVQRPIATLMVVFVLLMLGIVSLGRLPLALMPELNLPFAVVVADYPNVGPREVESQVTRPIEEAVATVQRLKNVSSISLSGQSTVIAEFEWGTDMDFAALEMRERVELLRDALPAGVGAPRIFRFDPTQDPIMHINIGGDMSVSALRAFAEDHFKSRLERLEGVASVDIVGGRDREIRVAVDPTRLDQFGLSYDQINNSLAAANLNRPGGQLTDAGREWIIRTVGEFEQLADIERVVVDAGPNRVVRLSDVARVEDGYKDAVRLARLNGSPSVALSIQRESGGNTVQVSARVREELDRLQAEFAQSVQMQIIWDDADFIRLSIRSVAENALLGAFFATMVLLAFLRNWRSTLVLVTAIPTAGVATFALLYFTDTSLNMLSLGGLALGVGMLVDNGIVVLESIFRHREEGSPALKAAGDGAHEVSRAIAASTLTTLAVFLPIVFLDGIASEIFRDLSYAVSFAVLTSLLVALTLVPMLAGRFLGHTGSPGAPAAEATLGPGGGSAPFPDSGESTSAAAPPVADDPLRPGAGAFGRLQGHYTSRLLQLMGRRWVAVVALVLIVSGGIYGALQVGQEFMPQMDSGDFNVRVEMPPGTALQETNQVITRLEEFVAGIPEVATVFANVGGSRADRGGLTVGLVGLDRRNRSTQAVMEEVRVFGKTLPGAEITARVTDAFGGGGAGGGGAPVEVRVKGDNLEELERYAAQFADRIAGMTGLREVETSLAEGRPELQVRVDRDRAAGLGLSVHQIASSLRDAVEGRVGTRFRVGGDELDVRVRLDDRYRESVADLDNILIDTPVGVRVPMHEVARIVEGTSPVGINRDGQVRVVRVQGQLFERDLGSVMAEIRTVLEAEPLPPGMAIEYGGDDVMMEEAFSSLGLAFVLAVLLVFMILAAQFESITLPLTIMIAVPLAVIGAMWGLWLTDRPLSVPAFVGVIMLAGIVVNNAIVLVDYINQLRARGMERLQAILWGCRIRLRPVLMTAITTILGMLPLALGLGEGAELQAPIATVVIGGLLVSTLLTLGFVPIMYAAVGDFEQWFARAVLGRNRDPITPSLER